MIRFAITLLLSSSPERAPHAGELQLAIDRLGTVGTVMYIAAHPDDENTRLLTWLVRSRHLRAVYLSLTRGEGGQNLVGTEQDELLGLIRTQELLAARRIDGAEQRFTRARDFGYSKSADESLRIWGQDAVLADVVWAIRSVRPDIIVTRFTTEPPNHGHHTASATLAAEAFTAAADPARFPEQLVHVKPWQPARLLHNVSHWRFTPETDLSGFLKVDIGDYLPLLGETVGEMAARSRSMHKSQGFGVAPERGPIPEYFQWLQGSKPAPDLDPFGGVATDWTRFADAPPVARAMAKVSQDFDPAFPERAIPSLIAARATVAGLSDEGWRLHKLAEIDALIVACAGLSIDARAPARTLSAGDTVPVTVTVTARQAAGVEVQAIALPHGVKATAAQKLSRNVPFSVTTSVPVPASAPASSALPRRAVKGLYPVENPLDIGQPEPAPPLEVRVTLAVLGVALEVAVPIVTVWVDPVDGEQRQGVEVAPPLTTTFEQAAIMAPAGRPTNVRVRVEASSTGATGSVRLEGPPGWTVAPAEVPVAMTAAGESSVLTFRVTPPKNAVETRFRAITRTPAGEYSSNQTVIEHAHIPRMTLRESAEVRITPLVLARSPGRIGAIQGPGDRVAESLAAVGYDVTYLAADSVFEDTDLGQFRTLLIGVRAFNHSPALALARPKLMAWVQAGGRLVCQYMTQNRLNPLKIELGPYPLQIGAGRVTDETARMVAKDPKHPALTTPNLLTPADFDGWVQERGLYFAETWDPKYQAVFSAADPAEAPLDGALLVGRYGKGVFVYTGLSFFRQLPAGVPGAYRLLANILAL